MLFKERKYYKDSYNNLNMIAELIGGIGIILLSKMISNLVPVFEDGPVGYYQDSSGLKPEDLKQKPNQLEVTVADATPLPKEERKYATPDKPIYEP